VLWKGNRIKEECRISANKKKLNLIAKWPIRLSMEGFFMNIIFLGWLGSMVFLAIRKD
jgi:hypothetical protein